MTQEGLKMFELDKLAVTEEVTELWQAAELLVSADTNLREQGFTLLTHHETARFSPLVCYLLVSLLDDPDLALRAASIHVLAGVFARNNDQYIAPDETRNYVSELLCRFRSEQIVHMLEVMGGSELSDTRAHPEALARLLDRTPDVNQHLTHIAANRRQDHKIRIAAVHTIGELGLLAALPELQSIRNRISTRRAGQLSMRFAPLADPAAAELLQVLEETIQLLQVGS